MAFFLVARTADGKIELVSSEAFPSRQDAMNELSRLSADSDFQYWDDELVVIDLDRGAPVLMVRPTQAETETAVAEEPSLPTPMPEVVEPAVAEAIEAQAAEEAQAEEQAQAAQETPESPEQEQDVAEEPAPIPEAAEETPTAEMPVIAVEPAIAEEVLASVEPTGETAEEVSIDEVSADLFVTAEELPALAEDEQAEPVSIESRLGLEEHEEAEEIEEPALAWAPQDSPESPPEVESIASDAVAAADEEVAAEADSGLVTWPWDAGQQADVTPATETTETVETAESVGSTEMAIADFDLVIPKPEALEAPEVPDTDASFEEVMADELVMPEASLESPASIDLITITEPEQSLEEPEAAAEVEEVAATEETAPPEEVAAPGEATSADVAPEETSPFDEEVVPEVVLPEVVLPDVVVIGADEGVASRSRDEIADFIFDLENVTDIPEARSASAREAEAAEKDAGPRPGPTCSECVYDDTCPNREQRSPEECGSFQWKTG